MENAMEKAMDIAMEWRWKHIVFMECFGKLPYDVGYQKKHIRPNGGGWGLLLYPAQQSPCWLN